MSIKLPTPVEFIKGPRHISWCKWKHTESGVYLRKSQHLLADHTLAPTVDISNLSVQPRWQNQGVFCELALTVAGNIPPDWYVYVENVQTARFASHFRRFGWDVGPITGLLGEPCFYMRTPDVLRVYSQLALDKVTERKAN